MITTTNSIALQLLKGLETNARPKDLTIEWTRPPNRWSVLDQGMGGIKPISEAVKDATAKITEIISQSGGAVDLSNANYTSSYISAMDDATIIGGAGHDTIDAGDNATVIAGGGNDNVAVYSNAKVDGGAGDDRLYTGDYSDIVAGDGDDAIYAEGGYSKVNAGGGDDYVYGNQHMEVDGGTGNDEIRTYDYATVDAGEGDDLVVTYGASTIKGGAGNDILLAVDHEGGSGLVRGSDPYQITFGSNDLDGGDGDDYIQTTTDSTVRGGAGNDTIRLIGAGSTVNFSKGDGQDAILSRDDFTLSIGGYKKEDVTVNAEGETLLVSFGGSEESISLTLNSGATAHLVFEDGSSLDIAGSEERRGLEALLARPDWVSTGPFRYGYR